MMQLLAKVITLFFLISTSESGNNLEYFKDRRGEVLSIKCVRALDASLEHVRERLRSRYKTKKYEGFVARYDGIECIDGGKYFVINFIIVDKGTGTVAIDSGVRVLLNKTNFKVVESNL